MIRLTQRTHYTIPEGLFLKIRFMLGDGDMYEELDYYLMNCVPDNYDTLSLAIIEECINGIRHIKSMWSIIGDGEVEDWKILKSELNKFVDLRGLYEDWPCYEDIPYTIDNITLIYREKGTVTEFDVDLFDDNGRVIYTY